MRKRRRRRVYKRKTTRVRRYRRAYSGSVVCVRVYVCKGEAIGIPGCRRRGWRWRIGVLFSSGSFFIVGLVVGE